MTAQFEHAYGAIVGSRATQEDACAFALLDGQASRLTGTTIAVPDSSSATIELAGSQELLAVLADGMGGHVGGAKASNLACQKFIDDYSDRTGSVSERLMEALVQSNSAIDEEVCLDLSLSGMGCTLIGAIFREGGLRWVSVGDSLLYVCRKGVLYHLNEDHSMAPVLEQLVEAGEMSAYEAKCHPSRNALRSAVTGNTIEIIDLNDEVFELENDDTIVIASDGLLSISENKITEIIAASKAGGAEKIVSELLAAVEAAGDPYQDNTTIMTVKPILD